MCNVARVLGLKAYRGSKGTAPPIVNLCKFGSRCRWVVNFTPGSLWPLNRELAGPQNRRRFGEEKTSCPCWESNADHPAQSLQHTLHWDPGPQCSVCCALLTVYLMSPFVAHMITEERVGKNLQRNTPDVIRSIIPKFFLNKLRKIMKMLLRIASTQAEIWTRVWHRRMMALVF